jgi:hypothetical protein
MGRLSHQTLYVFMQNYQDELKKIFGPDPFKYGVKANAAAIDFVQTISAEQSLTPRKQPLNEIFPQEVLISEERL